jgi:hypothetical protein
MQVDFEMSKDKVMMGVERRSMILSDEEKKNTAYHEAGHALVAAMTPGADPVHKVTIIPRGMALGLTMQLPEDDKHTYTREYLEAMLAVLMGGRSAEEIFLGHITTGAGNDIERATDLARNMVCEWGMSELGPLAYGKKDEAIFLGREITQHRDYSEDTAIQIDKEVKRIVNGGYENAKRLLSNNRETLERIAQALLEREVIDANEVKMLMEAGRCRKNRGRRRLRRRLRQARIPRWCGRNCGRHRDLLAGRIQRRRKSKLVTKRLVMRGTQYRAPPFFGRTDSFERGSGHRFWQNGVECGYGKEGAGQPAGDLPVLPGEAGGGRGVWSGAFA